MIGLLLWIAAGAFLHAWLPWALSFLSFRQGWTGELPSVWNLLSLVLVLAGFTVIAWSLSLHFVAATREWQVGDMTPRYLLIRGPYNYSRNPMYAGGVLIWLGWTFFYASLTVLTGLLVLTAGLALVVVPWEERRLEAHFGKTYKSYKNSVPRWLGRRKLNTLDGSPRH